MAYIVMACIVLASMLDGEALVRPLDSSCVRLCMLTGVGARARARDRAGRAGGQASEWVGVRACLPAGGCARMGYI